ncbi:NAD(P)-dependent alcohol dehydrogenase [Demequina activiva]|uniref:NADPH:quinone reductase n=1 Tax=Demequina activiva TaxID=1582364 RepID=A0A919Q520_9MICO|nr:NAD(P)-dependent alcohol dehydrogenase [Demequina activiva]GIG55026.1 NADPH:quinone reductase [Demequina activiva]
MQALAFDRYTDASGVTLRDLAAPTPAEGEVLIRVAAVGLNAWDWHQYRGEPTFMRLQSGLSVKEPRIIGADVAGTVEALGPGVSALAVGDRVMGEVGLGGGAELVAVSADAVVRIPEGVAFATAAATPMAGLTALQALRDAGELAEGERVLVWGASGGVGHLAVQIARGLGAARVEAVCSGRNAAMVTAAGADAVHDYTRDQRPEGPFDVILDTVATQSLRSLRTLLADGGRVVTVGAVGGGRLLGPASALLRRIVAAGPLRVRHRGMLAEPTPADLTLLASWLSDGSLRPVIQSARPLTEAHASLEELEEGHVAGKLILTLP